MILTPTPNKIDIERVALGAALSDDDSSAAIIEGLSADDFYETRHKSIFNAILEVFKRGMNTNIVTINDQLSSMKEEIPSSYLINLVETIPVTYNIDDFITILKKSSMERRIFLLSEKLKEGIIEVEDFTNQVISLPTFNKVSNETLQDLFVNTLVTASQGVAYKFGLEPLNKYLGGLDKGEIITIGGHTSQGKTALCIQLAIGFADRGYKVLYCTSEMTPMETARRILSNQTGVNIMDFRKGFLTDKEKSDIKQMGDTLSKIWNLTIKTTTNTTEIYRLVKKYNPDIVFVDHLQNLTRQGNYSDYQRVTYNMADLQSLALTQRIVCIVASQLKRKSEDRYSAPPIISDLRDSGAIEEKSNIVLFVYWRKRMLEEVKPRYGGEDPELLEVLISKNRDGVIGAIPLDFYPEYCKITEKEFIEIRRNIPSPGLFRERKDID